MSLKLFHLVFISLSIALAIGFGVWLFTNASGSFLMTISGIASFSIAGGLFVYARKFAAKFRHINSL